MTEAKANEILRTKYPEATITKGQYFGGSCTGRIVVTFKPGGKVYQYHGCSTYQQILERLGFNILYKSNVDNYKRLISDLERKISDGGEENKFHLFDKRDWIPFNPEEISRMEQELKEYKDILENAIIA